MSFLPNFNFHSFSKNNQQNNQFLNLRYFPKETNNNFLLNDFYSPKETSKSEDYDYYNSLTNEQLNSLKLYKFDSNIKTMKKEENEEENYDKSSFIPINKLLNNDFEKMVENKDFDSIKKLLPQMTFQNYRNKDLPNPKNSNMKPLLVKYQQVLKYLLNLEKNMIKFNSVLDQNAKKAFSPELNNLEKEKSYNKKIEENERKINLLLDKINKYKNKIILENKNKKRPLASFVLVIKDIDNNFYCDLCPDEIFKSYKDVQIHSLHKHEQILKLRKKNYEMNNIYDIPSRNKNNFEQKYLDTQMKYIEDELGTFIENLNKNKREKIILNNAQNNNLENDENIEDDKDKTINDNDLIILEKRINNLEEIQKKNQELLLENFNSFKNEIFSKIKDFKVKQKLIIEKAKTHIINKEQNIKINDDNNNDINMNLNNNNTINNINNMDSTTNKNNINNTNINDLELGEVYQENTTVIDSVNLIFNQGKNDISNQIKNENLTKINSENIIHEDEKENINDNKSKINPEEINKPNFEINNNSKIDPNIYNFAKKYCNRENQILFTKNLRQSKVLENYNILEENNEKENIYLKNEDELIEELRDKYQLNKEDISKSGYKNIINEIINKNENVQDANYKAYYNNILSFLEINRDLNSSIIK